MGYHDEWDAAVKWADEHGVWRLAKMIAGKKLEWEYSGSDEGIGSSDINGRAVSIVQSWMKHGMEHIERDGGGDLGILIYGIGNRIAGVNLDKARDNLEYLAMREDVEMPTTTGAIGGPTGDYGWGSPGRQTKMVRSQPRPGPIKPKRRVEAPESPEDESDLVEPAPAPQKRAKQLLVGEKNPFLERLERYLSQNLGEMDDFQLLGALTGPAKPSTTGSGVGAKAKEIQQRVGVDNSQRSEGDLSKSPNADVEGEEEEV